MAEKTDPEPSRLSPATSPPAPDETTCHRCRRVVKLSACACPYCGTVFEGLLLNTINPKSLSGPEKEAYWKGHGECSARLKQGKTVSVPIPDYCPSPGFENAYRAGWKKAAEKHGASREPSDSPRGTKLGCRSEEAGDSLIALAFEPLTTLGIQRPREPLNKPRDAETLEPPQSQALQKHPANPLVEALAAGAFAGAGAGVAAHYFAGGKLTFGIWIAAYVLVIANVKNKLTATIVFVAIASLVAAVFSLFGPSR